MSRPLRLGYPGVVWHMTCRGSDRREVFHDDGDRERFLGILGRAVCRARKRSGHLFQGRFNELGVGLGFYSGNVPRSAPCG